MQNTKPGSEMSKLNANTYRSCYMNQLIREIEIGRWFKNLNLNQKSKIKKLLNEIFNKVLEKKIHIEVITIKKYNNGNYYVKDAIDTLVNRHGEKIMNKPFLLIPLKINENKIDLGKNNCINIQHNKLSFQNKLDIKDLLKNEYAKSFIWDGDDSKTLCIKI
jgi:hypothetical protein